MIYSMMHVRGSLVSVSWDLIRGIAASPSYETRQWTCGAREKWRIFIQEWKWRIDPSKNRNLLVHADTYAEVLVPRG
jgi:hypothetical protein